VDRDHGARPLCWRCYFEARRCQLMLFLLCFMPLPATSMDLMVASGNEAPRPMSKETGSQQWAGPLAQHTHDAMVAQSDFAEGIHGVLMRAQAANSEAVSGLHPFDLFPVTVGCPPGQPLSSYGRGVSLVTLDGQHERRDHTHLCNLTFAAASSNCLIISMGSDLDFTFESDMLQSTGCHVHTFDCTKEGTSIHQRHTYHNACIGVALTPGDARYVSWSQMQRKINPGKDVVAVLRADISGAEFEMVAELSRRLPLPHQLAIKVHLSKPGGLHSMSDLASLHAHLANLGYGLISRADHPCSAVNGASCTEYSWLLLNARKHRFGKTRGRGAAHGGSAGMSTAVQKARPPGIREMDKFINTLFNNIAMYVPNSRGGIDDAQGWMDENVLKMFDIIQRPCKVIIEVGSWKGRSALNFGKHIIKSEPEGVVLCIDTWLGAPEFWTWGSEDMERGGSLILQDGYPSVFYTFLNNVYANQLQDTVVPFPISSEQGYNVLTHYQFKVDAIYIDASHEQGIVYREMSNFWELLSPGGVLFGDDYMSNWPGVIHDVDLFAKDKGHEYIVHGVVWFIVKNTDV